MTRSQAGIEPRPTVVIVMGVSGSGKTTVGTALARRLGWTFVEGDDFHSAHNVEKMATGHPLTDEDRAPWLAALRKRIDQAVADQAPIVLACSALRHSYRSVLAKGLEKEVQFVQLEVPRDVLLERLRMRVGHYMPPELLDSQLATLEHSSTAIHVDGTKPVDAIVEEIIDGIR
jgi:gluconokinase